MDVNGDGSGPGRPARFQWSAVAAIAGRELRRGWRATTAVGIAAGLIGAIVVGSLAVARRTATAYDRLVAGSAIDDVRATVFADDPGAAARVAALPEVEKAWVTTLVVAKVDGPSLDYVGMFLGPARPPDLLAPIVVAGRAADPADPFEVVAIEEWAHLHGVEPGRTLALTLLTSEEFAAFDDGFGEPDGPRVEVRVTGLVRVPGQNSPLFVSPVLADQLLAGPADLAAGSVVLLRLRDGPAGVAALRAGVARIAAGVSTAPEAGEFLPIQVDVPAGRAPIVGATARVLVGGLAVLALVTLVAGGVAVGQALARQHQAAASDQWVEAALGITGAERVTGRTLAAFPAVVAATIVTALGAVAAGWFEPMGAIAAHEPNPGPAPNLAICVAGAALSATAVAALVAVSGWRAGRRGTAAGVGRRRAQPGGVAKVSRLAGRYAPTPSLAAGLVLALPRTDESRGLPVRSTVVGAVVGISGLVATATVAAGRDRLLATPGRWGWQADAVILNANQGVVDPLLADPRVGGVSLLDRALVRAGGVDLDAHAVTRLKGGAGWTLLAGRDVAHDDEVVVGPRVRDRLGVAIGDSLDGEGGPLRVVGVGVGPPLDAEALGGAILLTPGRLADAGQADPLREALISVGPGLDPASVLDDLSAGYELRVREPPTEVANLGQLGRLPAVLGGILAAVGVVALVHALATASRRRRRDLAVLQAIGFAPHQTARAVTVVALLTAGAGMVVGMPLGFATGRLVWWAMARAGGVATDPVVPWATLAAVVVGCPVVALAASLLPARAAARLRPSTLLRDA